MKSLYKTLLLVGCLLLSTGAFAYHSTALAGCGKVCGKANIHVWLYNTIDQYWENNNNIPDELYWTGEYYFKIVDKNTGITQTLVGGTFSNLLVFTTTYSDGSKISSLDKTRFMSASDLQYDLPVDAGVYDIYEYAHYTLNGIGYSQTFTIGSLSVPQTMSDGVSYPLSIGSNWVQSSNTPDDISIDGYRGSLYDPIPVYTCKSAWPIRLYYDNITECRTYEAKVDWADVSGLDCSADVVPFSGNYFTFSEAFSPNKEPLGYLERMDLNMMLAYFPLSNPSLIGHKLKLIITIRGKNNSICPPVTITKCIVITASPGLTTGLKIKKGNNQGYANPYQSLPVSGAPLCGYHTAAFNVNTVGAIEQFHISLDYVDNFGSIISNLVSNYILYVPTSGGIPDQELNLINVPQNSLIGWSGGTGFFSWAGQNNKLYFKLSVYVSNSCGYSIPQWSYFRLDPSTAYLKIATQEGLSGFNSLVSDAENINTDTKLPEINIQNLNKDVDIYPNPCTDHLFFHNLQVGTTIEIIDIMGHTIKREKVSGIDLDLDVSSLKPQLYLCRISSIDGKIEWKHIAKS
jgi:hypothetical protein